MKMVDNLAIIIRLTYQKITEKRENPVLMPIFAGCVLAVPFAKPGKSPFKTTLKPLYWLMKGKWFT